MASFDINTGLICHIHPCFDRHFLLIAGETPADALGSLMDIQNITDAVTGSAFIVDVLIPHGLTCQNIQVSAGAAVQKFRVCQLQHALCDRCVMLLDRLGNRPQHDRSRHIRRTAKILTAGIHQKHTFRRKRCAVVLGRLIMHHRCICPISADRWKGKIQITVDLTAQMIQIHRSGILRHRNFTNIFLDPVNKLADRSAVF